MTSHSGTTGSQSPELAHDAIGFREALAVGVGSTAPAYSLAAVIGTVTVIVGFQAPGALLASFVPMFLIAGAFFYMNRADQDAGTTFSWVTRSLGPWLGWLGGWAVITTGILVVGSLADVGARYTYELVGWEEGAGSKSWIMVLAVVYIVVMTAICIIGTELAGELQAVLIVLQIGALLLFAGVALYKVYDGTAPAGSSKPELDWLSPFAISGTSTLVSALLIGVFIYWGWESAVNLTEETRDSAHAPGLAAVLSTVILLVTYIGVSVAVLAYAGLETLAEYDDDDAIFAVLGSRRPRRAVGQARDLRHRHLGDRLDADHDHPVLANLVLDGPPERAAARIRRGSLALPHALVLDGGGRRAGHRVVRPR